jgi:hypothetical protein
VREELSGETDPVARLRIFTFNHLGYFIRNLVEMKVLSHEYECLEGEHHDEIAALRREYYQVAEEVVTAILETRPDRGVDPRIASVSLLGMMNWLYTWYRPQQDGGPETVAEQMTEIFLRGLLGGS